METLPDSSTHWPKSATPQLFRADLERIGLLPAPPLTPTIRNKLHRLATNPYCASAAVRLKDGTFLPRVVFEQQEEAVKWFVPFWRRFVRPDRIEDVERSPNQIPEPLVYRLWAIGNTSMTLLEFVAVMKDRKRFPCRYHGPSDFIALPEPYTPKDIVDIEVVEGIARNERTPLKEPDKVWCVYTGPPVLFRGGSQPIGRS